MAGVMSSFTALPCYYLLALVALAWIQTTRCSDELEVVCAEMCDRLALANDDISCQEACEHYLLQIAVLDDSYPVLYPDAVLAAPSGDVLKRSRQPNSNKLAYLRRGSRQKSAFIRIGRSLPDNFELDSEAGTPDFQDKRASSFVRIGRDPDMMKRLSSFVRIGRAQAGAESEADKRASSFVRIGRAGSHFVRIGKSLDDDDKRASSFVRIGKSMDQPSADLDGDKRASSFVRIGKKSDDSSDQSLPDKRGASEFVRIGKSSDFQEAEDSIQDKRASSFVRIGRAFGDDDAPTLADDTEKRASSFVRIGRAKFPGLKGLKRKSNFIRIGKKDDDSYASDSQE